MGSRSPHACHSASTGNGAVQGGRDEAGAEAVVLAERVLERGGHARVVVPAFSRLWSCRQARRSAARARALGLPGVRRADAGLGHPDHVRAACSGGSRAPLRDVGDRVDARRRSRAGDRSRAADDRGRQRARGTRWIEVLRSCAVSRPASSPSTYSWSPGASSSARLSVARELGVGRRRRASGRRRRSVARWGEMKNGWLGSFQALQ